MANLEGTSPNGRLASPAQTGLAKVALARLDAAGDGEQALARECERLRAIVDASRIGTWEWNLETGDLILNDQWAEMLGYTLAELQPCSIETCARLRHSDDQAAAMILAERHFAGLEPYFEAEVRMRHKDGHWVWILDRGRITERHANGSPRLMVGAHQDISARKAFEDRLQQAMDRSRLAIDVSGLGVWEQDPQTGDVLMDERMQDIYGVVVTDGRLSQAQAAALIHPDDQLTLVEDARRAFETERPVESVFRVVRPDGAIRHLRGSATLSSRPDGSQWLMGVNQDITRDVERAEELDAKRIEAEAASVAKSQFLATMSHEIRTPMNGVIGMLEVLQRKGLTDDQKEHADIALKSAQHLLHILNDVLDVSKLEAGQVRLELRDYSVIDLVHETATLFRNGVHAEGVRLDVRVDPAVPAWVVGDETRVRQILTNFVGNAMKFTDVGRVEIAIGYDVANARLKLSVRDTGVGIDPATCDRLFQRFVQADASTTRRYGGTGLGLAICRQLASLMDGEIGVESVVGEGSLFWFSVAAPPGQRPRASSVEPDDQVHVRSLRVLVAEDNETNQRVVSALLASFGHQATVVCDGAQAVAAVASGDFDVILMDVQMPVMDGPTATRRIRALGGRASMLPIIALTANALPGHRAEYLGAGMTDYVSKPIDVSALFAALQRIA